MSNPLKPRFSLQFTSDADTDDWEQVEAYDSITAAKKGMGTLDMRWYGERCRIVKISSEVVFEDDGPKGRK